MKIRIFNNSTTFFFIFRNDNILNTFLLSICFILFSIKEILFKTIKIDNNFSSSKHKIFRKNLKLNLL